MVLRIKSDVDLKELEKFGFVEKRKYIRKENIAIEKETKEILIQATNYCPYGDRKPLNNKNGLMIYIDNTLYDLIKARNSRKSAISGNLYLKNNAKSGKVAKM